MTMDEEGLRNEVSSSIRTALHRALSRDRQLSMALLCHGLACSLTTD